MLNPNTRTAVWREHARRLNAEFGGRSLKHCSLLMGQQFAVTPGALKACCQATHELGTPTICRYTAPTVDAKEFLTGLGQVIEANQAPDGPCAGCRYLVQTTVPRKFVKDYFHAVSLHDFSGCNSHCVYCAGSEYDLPVKFTATFDHTELFKDLYADRMIRQGATTVFWGGGEPTIVKTFDETSDFLLLHRIRQTINTSGVRFSAATERALNARMASVCVSVDSGTDETYARVKRNPNVLKVWDSIARYSATGGDVSVKYIIFSMNSDREDAEAFVDRCVEARVKRIRISADVRSVFGVDPDAAPMTEKEFTAAAIIRNRAVANGIAVVFEDIWLPAQLDEIGRIGGFDAHKNPGRLARLRGVSSLADAREFARLAAGVIRRRMS